MCEPCVNHLTTDKNYILKSKTKIKNPSFCLFWCLVIYIHPITDRIFFSNKENMNMFSPFLWVGNSQETSERYHCNNVLYEPVKNILKSCVNEDQS